MYCKLQIASVKYQSIALIEIPKYRLLRLKDIGKAESVVPRFVVN